MQIYTNNFKYYISVADVEEEYCSTQAFAIIEVKRQGHSDLKMVCDILQVEDALTKKIIRVGSGKDICFRQAFKKPWSRLE